MKKLKRQKAYLLFALIMSAFITLPGCSGSEAGGGEWNQPGSSVNPSAAPTVTAVSPLVDATDVPINTKVVTATFNKAMAPTTLTTTSFTLACDGTPITGGGAVTYLAAGNVATLPLPAATDLPIAATCTATITTVATDLAGTALVSNYTWNFITGATPDLIPPEVFSVSPLNNSIEVCNDKTTITATFTEAMDPTTIVPLAPPATITLMETVSTSDVPGTATYDVLSKTATFRPTAPLTDGINYTVTISTAATDVAQIPLALAYEWNFTAGAMLCAEPIALGLASTFGIASTGGVTNTLTAPVTQIHGDAVLNPNATCNAVEVDHTGGFGLCDGMAPTISGKVITNQYPDTTTAQAVTDALRATYLSITPANLPGGTSIAAGTTLGAPIADLLVEGDNLFYPGVYTSNTSILITGDLTLDARGDANATFVFQSASTVGTAPNARILLAGNAKASNIWWQAGSAATLQTGTAWQGNVLAYDDVTMVTGATSCGRLFAGAFTDGAFVFDSNVVSVPGNANAPPTCQ